MKSKIAAISLVTISLIIITGCGADAAPIDNGANNGNFGSAKDDKGATKPGGGAAADQTTREGFCATTGGVRLPGANATQCTADLAKQIFRFAVCSCDALDVSGNVESKSFDSKKGTENRIGGSVGTNASLPASGAFTVGGSLWTSKELTVTGNSDVLQDVHAGTVSANGVLNVGADLYASQAPDGNVTLGGKQHVPTPVTDPCNCAAPPISISQFIDSFATTNDNAIAKVTPASLNDPEPNSVIALECGRYYFDTVAANTSLTIKLAGRTAIFVKGDFDIAGAFDIQMPEGAELDLFIGGNLLLSGSSAFGSVEAPARMRIYVAGQTVDASGAGDLAANLYAPNAIVTFSGGNAVRGAVHARQVIATGALNVNYDEAILSLQGCSEAPKTPDSTCKTCNDCDAACTGGKCTACKTSADCCAPLQCSNGACIPSVR